MPAEEISPVLAAHFRLFRESSGALQGAEAAAARNLSGGRPGNLFGLVPERAVRVDLNGELRVLAVPGVHGVMVCVPQPREGGGLRWSGGGAYVEEILAGTPVIRVGQTTIGLVPDGIEEQPVARRDGSTARARVVSNVYALEI